MIPFIIYAVVLYHVGVAHWLAAAVFCTVVLGFANIVGRRGREDMVRRREALWLAKARTHVLIAAGAFILAWLLGRKK